MSQMGGVSDPHPVHLQIQLLRAKHLHLIYMSVSL